MLDTFPAVKETKRNVGGRGSSDCFMDSGENAVRGREMVPLNMDVFPSNGGVLFRQVPFPPSN